MKQLCRILALIGALVLLPAVSPAAAPESILPFDGGTGWLNSRPMSPDALRGKVVLVDFWEYTCINCLRTLPYLREWYKRYANDGFVIVGVHSPEFAFSADAKNVATAVKHLDVAWPVVLDSSFAIWNRYGNHTWPHELLYDQNGKLVENVEGEGGYPETEAKIQALLKAKNPSLRLPPIMALLPQDNYTKPGAVCYPRTAETFTGGKLGRIANARHFPNPAADNNYVDNPATHQDGAVYLQGYWRATPQGIVSADNSGHLSLRYHAIQVVSVLTPEQGSAVKVIVTQDGKPVARADAGADLQYDAGGNSYVNVDAPRAYDLVMNKRFGDHDLMLLPQRYGVGIYSFDFESCVVGSDT